MDRIHLAQSMSRRRDLVKIRPSLRFT